MLKRKKIVVIGPESTGKTTLCEMLAEHYNVRYVKEYARTYLEKNGLNYSFDDVLKMAKGQLGQTSNYDIQIFDTDILVYKIWIQEKYNKKVDFIEQAISEINETNYILCDVDIPWTFDEMREHPNTEDRKRLFSEYKKLLEENCFDFEVVAGTKDERFQKSISYINFI